MVMATAYLPLLPPQSVQGHLGLHVLGALRKQLQQPEHVHARVQRQDAVGGLRRAAA